MLHIFQAVVPYIAMSIALLGLILLIPRIATWLPEVLG
jgi:TRAP-type C4-dicarboxylate transport system permease large subunit